MPESLNRRTALPVALLALILGCTALIGCTVPWRRPELPTGNTIVRDQLVIHSHRPLPARHRLLDDLAMLRDDMTEQLELTTSDEPIEVYVFDSAGDFHAFMHAQYPGLPHRRAFFIESDTRLAVFAHWGDQVAEDLRHEVAHGYLHSVVPAIPLWLDEGLAEFFEVPRQSAGLNRPHVEHLLRQLQSGWRPDIARLETLRTADDMAQLDYAESWAWVHLLLTTAPQRRELLRWHLQDLRSQPTVEPFSLQVRRMLAQPEEALVEHLRGMAHQ